MQPSCGAGTIRPRALVLLVGLLCTAPALAQSPNPTNRESLIWMAWFGSVQLTPTWSVAGEFHERRFFDPFRVHQRAWRGHLHRRLTPAVQVGVGYTHFLQGEQRADRPALPLAAELRPHVQLDVRDRLGARTSLNHRLRLEYRAIPERVGGRPTTVYASSARLRYRLGYDFRLGSARERPILRLSDELHVMAGDRPLDRPFDQNRVQAGIDWPLGRGLALETAYLWWYQRRTAGGVVDRDYLRVSVVSRKD